VVLGWVSSHCLLSSLYKFLFGLVCLWETGASIVAMPPIVSLSYATFGSSSTTRNSRTRAQLTAIERLEEWKERDDESDISKEDADVTSALIGDGGALGIPEARRGSWFSSKKGKEQDPDDIATQVRLKVAGYLTGADLQQRSVFDDPDLAGQYLPRSDW